MPTDQTQRFLLENLDIRGAWVRLDSAWQDLCAGRNYPAPVSTLLGEIHVHDDLCGHDYRFDAAALATVFEAPEHRYH